MGKGSKPRNCFSKNFKSNYDEINWGKPKSEVISAPIKTWFFRILMLDTSIGDIEYTNDSFTGTEIELVDKCKELIQQAMKESGYSENRFTYEYH